jgi:hypothetical protein
MRADLRLEIDATKARAASLREAQSLQNIDDSASTKVQYGCT